MQSIRSKEGIEIELCTRHRIVIYLLDLHVHTDVEFLMLD